MANWILKKEASLKSRANHNFIVFSARAKWSEILSRGRYKWDWGHIPVILVTQEVEGLSVCGQSKLQEFEDNLLNLVRPCFKIENKQVVGDMDIIPL